MKRSLTLAVLTAAALVSMPHVASAQLPKVVAYPQTAEPPLAGTKPLTVPMTMPKTDPGVSPIPVLNPPVIPTRKKVGDSVVESWSMPDGSQVTRQMSDQKVTETVTRWTRMQRPDGTYGYRKDVNFRVTGRIGNGPSAIAQYVQKYGPLNDNPPMIENVAGRPLTAPSAKIVDAVPPPTPFVPSPATVVEPKKTPLRVELPEVPSVSEPTLPVPTVPTIPSVPMQMPMTAPTVPTVPTPSYPLPIPQRMPSKEDAPPTIPTIPTIPVPTIPTVPSPDGPTLGSPRSPF